MQIAYCHKCGIRVPEQDLTSGAAYKDAQDQTFCILCAVSVRPARSSAKSAPVRASPPGGQEGRASGAQHVIRPPLRPATREVPASARVGRATTWGARPVSARAEEPKAAPAPKTPLNPLLLAGGGLGVLGLILVVVSLTRGGGKPAHPGGEPPASSEKKASAALQTAAKEPAKAAPDTGREPPPAKMGPASTPAAAAPAKTEPAKSEPAAAAAGIDDIRESFARRKWSDIKAAVEGGRVSGRTAHRQVRNFVTTYASTAAGKEAAEFLKGMTTDEPPPPPGKGVLADYKRDFKPETPAPGWRYLWNADGEMGAASRYKDLVWNAERGYAGHSQQYPMNGPPGWTRLTGDGGHPGQGVDQGAGVDRCAIAAYTLQAGQGGKTAIRGSIARPHAHSGRVMLYVYANDTLKETLAVEGGEPTAEFALLLGELKEGDTVYVAVGPDRQDGNDSFSMEYTLYTVP